MINAGDLAMLRAAQESLCDQTGELFRVAKTRTAVGGTSEAWASQGSYPCRLAPARPPQEYIAAGRLSGGRTWWVTLAHDAGAIAGDRIVVGGLTLNVVGVQSGESYLTALRALCEEPA